MCEEKGGSRVTRNIYIAKFEIGFLFFQRVVFEGICLTFAPGRPHRGWLGRLQERLHRGPQHGGETCFASVPGLCDAAVDCSRDARCVVCVRQRKADEQRPRELQLLVLASCQGPQAVHPRLVGARELCVRGHVLRDESPGPRIGNQEA